MSNDACVEPHGFLRTLVRWVVKRYYLRIEITHAERIPRQGPVLLCANHPNSLLDPVLIGIAADRPVRFLAKAPLFDNPILGPPMRSVGMIPAYRGMDAKRDVRRNIESLDIGADVLAGGCAMGIFPEGISTDEAHLEMVRSGAARTAVLAMEKGAEGLQVVPLGITYQRKDRSRTAVWIQVGEPIDVRAWIEGHDNDRRQAMRALTKELESRLKEVVVHLEEPQWEPWLDDLETLAQPPQDPKHRPTPPLQQRKRLADAMNYFLETDRPRAEALAEEVQAYREQVDAAGLTVDSPVLRTRGLRVCCKLLWEFVGLVLLLIPALIGTIHHLAPLVLTRLIASRMDQPGRKTVSTNRLLYGAPVFILWYAAVGWWMLGYFSLWFTSTWLLAAPLAGLIAVFYWRKAGQAARLFWHQVKVTSQRPKLKQLRRQQADVRQQLARMSEEYARQVPRPEIAKGPRRRGRVAGVVASVLLVAIVAAIAWLAKYWFFDQRLSGHGLALDAMPEEQIRTSLDADESLILGLIDRLDQLEQEATSIQSDFKAGRRTYANQQDNDDVRELLRRYLAYRETLLRIVWKYQRHADIDAERLRLRAFLVDYTSAAMLYEASTKFVNRFANSSKTIKKLNEPEPEWGIPAGFYDRVQHDLANPKNVRMFRRVQQIYHQEQIQAIFDQHALLKQDRYKQFHDAIARAETMVREVDGSAPKKIVGVALSDAGDLLHKAQYEIQSSVSTWIGDMKIRKPRDGRPLITDEHLAKLALLLQPGDILLERRNWYLSNAFLPGYWPHGAIYVGTAEELQQRGLDQNEHLREHWEEFTSKDVGGRPHVIIEAVSEGVIFSSLEHSIGGADSVAVLRPIVGKEEKDQAIARAFMYVGRPYDFEFDFKTTDRLVCTEVVFRAYGGNSGVIRFPLETIMGRQTMPAINLVKKYDKEYSSQGAQFEFIAFIDGNEETGTSQFITDARPFRETLNRPGSTFLQDAGQQTVRGIGPLGWVLLSLTIASGIWAVTQSARGRGVRNAD